jgi:hypothetical protein
MITRGVKPPGGRVSDSASVIGAHGAASARTRRVQCHRSVASAGSTGSAASRAGVFTAATCLCFVSSRSGTAASARIAGPHGAAVDAGRSRAIAGSRADTGTACTAGCRRRRFICTGSTLLCAIIDIAAGQRAGQSAQNETVVNSTHNKRLAFRESREAAWRPMKIIDHRHASKVPGRVWGESPIPQELVR